MPNQPKKIKEQTPKRKVRVFRAPASRTVKPRVNEDERRFSLALTNPAADDAEGVRIPDMYPLPTATYRVRGVQTYTSAADGTLSFILNPSLSGTMFLAAGVSSGGLTSNTGSPMYFSAVTSVSSLVAGRIVSVGWRFKNLLNFSTVTGRVRAAPFTHQLVLPEELASYTPVQAGNVYADILNSSITPNVMNMLGAKEVTMDELIEEEFFLISRPVDPSGLCFKRYQTQNGLNATYEVGGDMYSTSTGLTQDVGNGQAASTVGMNSWVITASGLPANAAAFEIEYVIHVEAIPIPSGGTASALTPSNQHKTASGSRVYDILSAAAGSPLMGLVESLSIGTSAHPFISTGRRLLAGVARGRRGS